MKQEMTGRHQLDHVQIICTSIQTDNYASTSSINFLQAAFCGVLVMWWGVYEQCSKVTDKSVIT